MDSGLQNLRYALRSLSRSPGMTAAAVVTLALAIGANTAIFSAVHSILFRPLPYRDPDRLVLFWETAPSIRVPFIPIMGAAFHEYDAQKQVFEGMAGFRIRSRHNGRAMLLSTARDSLRVEGITISADFLDVLGTEPMIGRGFAAGEDQPGAERVALISHSLWSSFFGADRSAVGRRIRLNGEPYEIIGVLPPGFFFPPPVLFVGSVTEYAGQVFVPMWIDPDDHGVHNIRTVARLRAGVSLEQARAELQPVADRLVERFPEDTPPGLSPVLLPLHDQAVEFSRTRLAVLQAAVGFILLIACVNVANLILARGSARRREIAVRDALGAGRGRIVRLLLTESLLLALLGGGLGVVLAAVGVQPLARLGAEHVPRLGPVGIDFSVLAFSFLLTVLTAAVFGLMPALRASRMQPVDALRAARERVGERGSQALRRGLVISEVALAVIPLVGAGLMLRSLWQAQAAPIGFDEENVLSVKVDLPEGLYTGAGDVEGLFERLLGELRALPSVRTAGAASQLPFNGGRTGGVIIIEGRPRPDREGQANQTADIWSVAPGYFESLTIPLRQGRLFKSTDGPQTQPVALIDQILADRLWPDQDPVGARIAWGDESVWWTVVGVVGAIQYQTLSPQPQASGIIYVPQSQYPQRSFSIVLKTDGPPQALNSAVRRQIARLDPELAVEVRSLESYVYDAQQRQRSPALLLGILALLALVLASVGLYGVLSYLARQRTQEIGIRMALGADRVTILHLILSQTALMVLIGLMLGLAGALAISRLLAAEYLTGILFGVPIFDLPTYLGVVLVFCAVAALASYLPARRAMRVNPCEALRTE